MKQEARTVVYDDELRIEAYRFEGIARPFPNHFHEYYVIGFMEAGERVLSCKNQEYTISTGDVLLFNPGDRKTLFGNVVKKCIQCSRTSEKRNNIVKKFKYSASYFELYTKFTPNEKDFRCGFQISYEP